MASKKSTPSKRSFITLVKQHKLRTLLLVLVCVGLGVFSYQKYLDARNVSDMKQLLSAFEELKETIESETDQSVEIEANCGSVGKFATSYACTISLVSPSMQWDDDISVKIKKYMSGKALIKYCDFLSETSIGFNSNEDKFICSLDVRPKNKSNSESIFYKYDISPGRAF